MRRMRRRGTRAALLVGLTIAILAVGASVALGVVVRASGDNTVDYQQPSYTQPQGVHSAFENESIGPVLQFTHSVFSDDSLGGFKLFRSKVIGPGTTTPINGTQYLTAGDYAFHCSVHPGMKAALHVTNAGTPVARPEIEVTIKTTRIHKAFRRRGVRVQVDAATDSRNVAIRVEFKTTGKTAGVKKGIDLSAGQSKTVFVRFNGRAVLKLKKADYHHQERKIKATGSVPFGESDSDSQTLGF
jgi:hypothetical protein